jgi:DNA modification methylase
MNHVMDQVVTEDYALYNGDSAEVLPQLPGHSIAFSVFSPPFSSTYTYSPSVRDLGNVRSNEEFWQQFRWVSSELLRVMMPGRLVAVHVADLPTYANRDGASGRKDFSGETIQHFIEAGFVYHSRIAIQKNPQSQAIRTHSKGLLFVQMRRDRAALWQAWGDYICVFRAPGENRVPVTGGDFTEEEWIDYAAPVWNGIRETEVLDVRPSRENDDERHLCPLQLPVIERCIRLWTNPGETILDPFTGIGSSGYVAIKQKRRFVGIELKPSYYRVAGRYLEKVRGEKTQATLWATLPEDETCEALV